MSKPKNPTAKPKKPSKSATSGKGSPEPNPQPKPESSPQPDHRPNHQHSLEEASDLHQGMLDASLLAVMEGQLAAGIATVREGKVRDPNVLAAALVMLGLELLAHHTGHAAIAMWLEELADTYRQSPGRQSPRTSAERGSKSPRTSAEKGRKT